MPPAVEEDNVNSFRMIRSNRSSSKNAQHYCRLCQCPFSIFVCSRLWIEKLRRNGSNIYMSLCKKSAIEHKGGTNVEANQSLCLHGVDLQWVGKAQNLNVEWSLGSSSPLDLLQCLISTNWSCPVFKVIDYTNCDRFRDLTTQKQFSSP